MVDKLTPDAQAIKAFERELPDVRGMKSRQVLEAAYAADEGLKALQRERTVVNPESGVEIPFSEAWKWASATLQSLKDENAGLCHAVADLQRSHEIVDRKNDALAAQVTTLTEDRERLAAYAALLERGMGAHEARETIWPSANVLQSEVDRLREALAIAVSSIKSGEPWHERGCPSCRIIATALAATEPSQEPTQEEAQ